MKKIIHFLFGEYCPLNSPLVEKIIGNDCLSKDLLNGISELNKGKKECFISVNGIDYRVTKTIKINQ